MRHLIPAIALSGLLLGLTATALPRTVSAASFDCDRSDLAADEKVICDTRTLNDADVKMVTTFDILTSLMAMGNRGKLQDEQSAWLKRRQACGEDVECLRAAYGERLKQLDEAYKNLNRPL
ncbi:lysozyme inhibitor LprI family protein [Neorhizobium sp. LjRoot104]|uniref:lysozyme inhibitor LprI family protein n=1 Tax=Neorhizobium sp. LjRoot104 TaxID=3342254 RepID=UPI003ECC27DD